MKKPYQLALHIFRRDLRISDNTALLAAQKNSQQVLPIFIFDPRQVGNNDYKSSPAISFMCDSLQELAETLKKKNGELYFFKGIAEDIVKQLLKHLPIEAVFINRDYTPFSRQRDEQIKEVCDDKNVNLHIFSDCLLQEPEHGLKKNHQPYTIFTFAYKASSALTVAAPALSKKAEYWTGPIKFSDTTTLRQLQKDNTSASSVQAGRTGGLRILKKIQIYKNYDIERNFPALNRTTKLSAHLKFGTVSIREAYQYIIDAFGKNHTLVRELYWRDFFTHIGFHFPHVFSQPFNRKYINLSWSENTKKFKSWCEGNTGFPIVDAGMREMNATGFMHNRLRMITASFLVKDLRINWQWGEKYFAQRLVDYDPAVNNGNWQWAASTGCDSQPYFRIFNPWLQQKKYDSEARYIKQWLPELASIAAKDLHNYNYLMQHSIKNYPKPMLDHSVASQYTKMMYKQIVRANNDLQDLSRGQYAE